ncbi:MAG: FprA family A-type flavoprotein, partial [Thermoguttaceae bacterium]
FDISAWPIELVATGDCIRLGRRTLRFIETPMVHWPESMFTYITEDKLLFSMDAFGQHYASSQRFDDELPLEAILLEAKTYYANIIMPYGKAVAACIAKTAGLEIDVIAPSHGAIWRTGVAKILAAYHDWVAYRPKAKVLVLYDSMWESTARMAQAIAEGVAQQPGVEMQQLPLRGTSLTRIAAEVLDAAAVAFGSATLNRGMMPAAAAALHYLQGLRPLGKAGLAFGSYGWGGGGVEAIEAGLKAMPWDVIGPPLKAQYRPTAEILRQCRAAGKQLAEKASALAGVRSINGIAGLVSPYG